MLGDVLYAVRAEDIYRGAAAIAESLETAVVRVGVSCEIVAGQ
jgi:hypothetical protein